LSFAEGYTTSTVFEKAGILDACFFLFFFLIMICYEKYFNTYRYHNYNPIAVKQLIAARSNRELRCNE